MSFVSSVFLNLCPSYELVSVPDQKERKYLTIGTTWTDGSCFRLVLIFAIRRHTDRERQRRQQRERETESEREKKA